MSRYGKDEETISQSSHFVHNKNEAAHFGDISGTNWEDKRWILSKQLLQAVNGKRDKALRIIIVQMEIYELHHSCDKA